MEIIEEQGEKQIKALENRVEKCFLRHDKKSIASLFLKDFLNEAATHKIKNMQKWEKKLDRNDLSYKTGNKKNSKTYGLQKFKTIRSIGREIYSNDLYLDNALEQKIRLKDDIDLFKESVKKENRTNS